MNWNIAVPASFHVARPSGRTVGLVGIVVAALGILVGVGWLWTTTQQQRGSSAYAATLLQARQSETPDAGPQARAAAMSDLERVLAEYPSNAMAPQAAYALGNLRFAAGQYDGARAAWQVAVARAASGTIATLARAGIGYAWEAERKFPEATQAYETALGSLEPADFYYEELLVDLARAQELTGKKDAAIATYRRLLKDVPKSVRSEEIRNRLASLGAAP